MKHYRIFCILFDSLVFSCPQFTYLWLKILLFKAEIFDSLHSLSLLLFWLRLINFCKFLLSLKGFRIEFEIVSVVFPIFACKSGTISLSICYRVNTWLRNGVMVWFLFDLSKAVFFIFHENVRWSASIRLWFVIWRDIRRGRVRFNFWWRISIGGRPSRVHVYNIFLCRHSIFLCWQKQFHHAELLVLHLSHLNNLLLFEKIWDKIFAFCSFLFLELPFEWVQIGVFLFTHIFCDDLIDLL